MPTKLGDMTSAGALAGTELVYVQVGTASGDERQSTVDAFKTYTLAGFSANGLSLGAAANYAAMRALLDLEAGTDFNAYSANLAALSAQATTGMLARTGAGTYATRTLTAPAAGITITDGDGVAGNPTLVLANDLAALEALSGTDTIYYRSGVSTWSAVTIGSGITFSAGTLSAPAVGLSDGDKGDITVSGTGATWTIDNDVVTYAKMQNVSADSRILGRASGAGAGDVTELTGAQAATILGTNVKSTESLVIACSDETTAITTGTAKVTFRMPYAFTLTAVRASVTTAPTGSTLIIDINEDAGGGSASILSTKLSIDISEKTSTTAASAAVISDSALADDAEITIDFDQVGSTIAGAGVKVYLIGNRA